MRFLYFCSILFFLTSSCKKSGFSFKKVESISSKFFVEPKIVFSTGRGLVSKATISYTSSGAIKKRSGSLPILPGGGYAIGYHTDLIFDTIIRPTRNKLILQRKNYTLPQPQFSGYWEYTLKDDLPVARVSYSYRFTDSQYIALDTVYYFYDSNRRLQRVENHRYGFFDERTFHYDEYNNLRKVIQKNVMPNNAPSFTTVEEFSLYDNSPNLLRQFWIWDDLLYRSVSSSNFGKYERTVYDLSGNVVNYSGFTCNYVYDERGNIDYSR